MVQQPSRDILSTLKEQILFEKPQIGNYIAIGLWMLIDKKQFVEECLSILLLLDFDPRLMKPIKFEHEEERMIQVQLFTQLEMDLPHMAQFVELFLGYLDHRQKSVNLMVLKALQKAAKHKEMMPGILSRLYRLLQERVHTQVLNEILILSRMMIQSPLDEPAVQNLIFYIQSICNLRSEHIQQEQILCCQEWLKIQEFKQIHGLLMNTCLLLGCTDIPLDLQQLDLTLQHFKTLNAQQDLVKIERLKIMTGYLQAFDSKATPYLKLYLTDILSQLSKLLTPSQQLDLVQVKRLHPSTDLQTTHLQFQFEDDRILDCLNDLASTLGKHDIADAVEFMVLENTESIAVLKLFIQYLPDDRKMHIIKHILDSDLKSPVSKILMLQSISQAQLTPHQIQYLLMDDIYTLLQFLGDSNYWVQEEAKTCLTVLAQTRGNSSVSQLVMEHVDYLVDATSYRIKNLVLHPLAPKVLIAAIKATGQQIIGPLMHDTLDNVLNSLKSMGTTGYLPGHGPTVTRQSSGLLGDLMLVLYHLLQVCPTPRLEIEQQKHSKIQELYLKHKSPGPELLEQLSVPKEGFHTQTSEESEHPMDAKNEPEEEPLSDYESLALRVMEQTQYLLYTDCPPLRMVCLRIFTIGLPILSNRPTKLNPLIHSVWNTLASRLSDHGFVAVEALQVLSVICKTSKDFVRKRIQDNIIQLFSKLLSQMQHKSTFTTRSNKTRIIQNTFTTTSESRQFETLLECLKSVVQYVPLLTNDIHHLTTTLLDFLNNRFTPSIHHLVQQILIETLKRKNEWVVCLIWHRLGSPDIRNLKPLNHKQGLPIVYDLVKPILEGGGLFGQLVIQSYEQNYCESGSVVDATERVTLKE
ncbi:hypothetical protein EDD86DRAFT_118095 [Gorgonomyces haynaldii]|nr:hypothetical protein EDD86DRAFT_118095 [Gorgonomyces haynaldii]